MARLLFAFTALLHLEGFINWELALVSLLSSQIQRAGPRYCPACMHA